MRCSPEFLTSLVGREEPALGGFEVCSPEDRRSEHGEQKPQPFQKQAEVVADGGQDGVAAAADEIISAHAMLRLEMIDNGFDHGPSSK